MAVVAVMVSALVGGFFGGSVLATQDRVTQRYKVFGAALAAVEGNYIGEVESDRLVYQAIGGMLQTLDPHSSFMDPRSYAQLRERQEGRYYGLGISITVIDGNITVMSLFEGSPAYKKGYSPRRHHRQDRRRDCQGVEQRTSRQQVAWPERHVGQHLDQASGV